MPEDEKQLHSGHRQRLYDSYRRAGLDGFSDVTVLELLLTFAIPRRDTNELAHRLLNEFGSLHAVFDAPLEYLVRVKGMTPRAALLVHMQPRLWQRCEQTRQKKQTVCRTTLACAEVLHREFLGAKAEQVWMMSLDAKCRLLDVRKLSNGAVSSSALPTRKIVETALAVGAVSVVIAHNHTSGIVFPSKEDLQVTQVLRTALDSVELVLADHLIFAGSDFYSMRDNGLL